MSTYGVNTMNGGYVDVSKTLRGAKRYATINGFKEVYIRFNGGYNISLVAKRIANKWIDN
jgi:hypothetical protein